MYIGNNYMVNTKRANGIYHNEYFIDEKSAITYANECYKHGDMEIELLRRGIVGYYRIKKIIRKFPGSPLYEVKL